MKNTLADFEDNGFTVLDSVLSGASIDRLESKLHSIDLEKAGTRNLLASDWCAALAKELKSNPDLALLLPADLQKPGPFCVRGVALLFPIRSFSYFGQVSHGVMCINAGEEE